MSSQLSFSDVPQTLLGIDPCERKHKGSPESVAAHQSIIHTKQQTYKKIMSLLSARGEFGATSKELAYAMGKQLHAISGRLAELKAMNWIRATDETREGARVLVVSK